MQSCRPLQMMENAPLRPGMRCIDRAISPKYVFRPFFEAFVITLPDVQRPDLLVRRVAFLM